MKRWLHPGLFAILFVTRTSAWAWAFLTEPFGPIPFVVRGLLTLGLFGSTTFSAWTLLKRQIWTFAMVAAMAVSLLATVVCVVPYTSENIDFLPHRSRPITPCDAAYLLAAWAIALPWGGWLAFGAGVMAVTGPIATWFLSAKGGSALRHRGLRSLLKDGFETFRKRPARNIALFLSCKLAPLVPGLLIASGLCVAVG